MIWASSKTASHFETSSSSNSQRGMTLVEILVVVGIMSVMMLAFLNMQRNQMNANNFVDFQLKKTQLRTELIGQVLINPDNCMCLFNGAAQFPSNPTGTGATLSGMTAPSQIGIYTFATPGSCATASIPLPLISTAGVNGVAATSIQLTNILQDSMGNYEGHLQVGVQSLKTTLGPSSLQPIDIAVSVQTTPGGPGTVVFKSCSMYAQSPDTSMMTTKCTWVNSGCTPPACPAGFTDAGVISNELEAMDKPYNGGSNQRFCYKGTGHKIEVRCSWVNSTCLPAACPSGFTDSGVLSNELTALSKPYNGGNTIRTCFN